MAHEKLTSILADSHAKNLKTWEPWISYNDHLNMDYSLLSIWLNSLFLRYILGWTEREPLLSSSPSLANPLCLLLPFLIAFRGIQAEAFYSSPPLILFGALPRALAIFPSFPRIWDHHLHQLPLFTGPPLELHCCQLLGLSVILYIWRLYFLCHPSISMEILLCTHLGPFLYKCCVLLYMLICITLMQNLKINKTLCKNKNKWWYAYCMRIATH